MSQNEPVAAGEPLTALARRANDAHSAFSHGAGEALAHAIEAGSALREAKHQMPFGQWLPWLAENVEFSERTARLYMQLAADPATANRQRVADLSLRAAAKMVATPRATKGNQTAPRELAAGEPPAQPSPARPPSQAKRDPNMAKLDALARVRQVLSAIDPVLGRVQSGQLSSEAAAELLREAATATRAVADGLDALALELAK